VPVLADPWPGMPVRGLAWIASVVWRGSGCSEAAATSPMVGVSYPARSPIAPQLQVDAVPHSTH